jgi:hypothetical protein
MVYQFTNKDAEQSTTVKLSWYGQDGMLVAVPVRDYGNLSTVTFDVPARATKFLELDGTAVPNISGWVRVDYGNGAANVLGQAVFRWSVPNRARYEATVNLMELYQIPACSISIGGIPVPPVPIGSQRKLTMQFDNTDGSVTGAAYARAAGTAGQLELLFIDTSGEELMRKQFDMPPYGQIAKTLAGEEYAAIAGRRGSIVVNDGHQYLALGFKFNRDLSLTTLFASRG